MNPERLQAKGLLADLKKKKHKLEADAAGRLTLIRTLLNPYEPDPTVLDVDKVANEATELKRIVEDLRGINGRISRLEDDLE